MSPDAQQGEVVLGIQSFARKIRRKIAPEELYDVAASIKGGNLKGRKAAAVFGRKLRIGAWPSKQRNHRGPHALEGRVVQRYVALAILVKSAYAFFYKVLHYKV
eukprot:CAMPEP_0172041058 /NCGR_PEP_ID=MMETSP1041-20130122/24840_1 /TAXON_ID=464988 /ORGANISM="Hemiselmis andersenii, Strain CCMP439" /LENGTH=103 /DNA_ID=CAMNT_0012699019 /DNA_START=342 /DNA_END=652 /DNA_ORIENTATION=+